MEVQCSPGFTSSRRFGHRWKRPIFAFLLSFEIPDPRRQGKEAGEEAVAFALSSCSLARFGLRIRETRYFSVSIAKRRDLVHVPSPVGRQTGFLVPWDQCLLGRQPSKIKDNSYESKNASKHASKNANCVPNHLAARHGLSKIQLTADDA